MTATDLTKARIALDILVCMFSEYCEEPFTWVDTCHKEYDIWILKGNLHLCFILVALGVTVTLLGVFLLDYG